MAYPSMLLKAVLFFLDVDHLPLHRDNFIEDFKLISRFFAVKYIFGSSSILHLLFCHAHLHSRSCPERSFFQTYFNSLNKVFVINRPVSTYSAMSIYIKIAEEPCLSVLDVLLLWYIILYCDNFVSLFHLYLYLNLHVLFCN